MISKKERQEMLADGKSAVRRKHFRIARKAGDTPISFEEYLLFLNDVQKIFSPFPVSKRITPTKFNKL